MNLLERNIWDEILTLTKINYTVMIHRCIECKHIKECEGKIFKQLGYCYTTK